MKPIPSEYHDLFEKPSIAAMATLRADGSPHITPVWVDYDGEYVKIVIRKGTQKYANVRRDSRVALTVIDPDDAYRHLSLSGEVAEYDDEGALDFTDEMANRYWDVDEFPYARDEPRSLLFVSPHWIRGNRIPTP